MSLTQKFEFDSVTLEVLRTRLSATAEEGASTIERTACNPAIAESRDCSSTLLEADGKLIIGGGAVAHHFGVCDHAVQSTIAIHGASLAPGDVFIANDPHNGGGLHYQDVVVQRPIFVDGQLIAWSVNSGHMMDMGGMAFGSWSPKATECYQEALRFPPVRLYRAGIEEADVWAILRNNVRLSQFVEMDIRSLIAGCQIANDKIVEIAKSYGPERFVAALNILRERTEKEMRRRISLLEDGVYKMTTWTEWESELFKVPCSLIIEGDHMVFDFEGAAPQCNHFFNSKPHIIRAIVVSDITDVIAHDLPLSAGVFAPIEVRCPPGTVVNANPPAPTASSHFDVALNASMIAQQCVMMAITASTGSPPGNHLLSGPLSPSSMGLHTWYYKTHSGATDGLFVLDGALTGGAAGFDRDGYDLFSFMVARKSIIETIDVELFESRYPLLVLEKRPRPGTAGAGRYRSGAGCEMSYKPYGVEAISGVMLGMRERLPLLGLAGGSPGANTEFAVRRRDGQREVVSGHSDGLIVKNDEIFEMALGSAGGYGDPVDRDPAEVARDVIQNRLTSEEAAKVYGVVLDKTISVDSVATEKCRKELLSKRLATARKATNPIALSKAQEAAKSTEGKPLYPGVEQRGSIAYSVRSGAPLAVAPNPWTAGCPMIEEQMGSQLSVRTYLDPITGHAMLVDAAPLGEACTIETRPSRWTASAP